MASYNVWNNTYDRWTNFNGQIASIPRPLSLAEARAWYAQLIKLDSSTFQVRVLLPDNTAGAIIPEYVSDESCLSQLTAVPAASGVAVNDHICPHCRNNRCSKNEKTCWKCGGILC